MHAYIHTYIHTYICVGTHMVSTLEFQRCSRSSGLGFEVKVEGVGFRAWGEGVGLEFMGFRVYGV